MSRLNFILAFLLTATCTAGMAQVKKPVAKPAAAAGAKALLNGKILYTTHCLVCHQADGLGIPNMNPPLTQTKQVLGPKPDLIKILLKGLNGELEVNGEVYGTPMPAFDYLKDQEIADILSYVRSNFKNKANAVSAAEVKAARTAK